MTITPLCRPRLVKGQENCGMTKSTLVGPVCDIPLVETAPSVTMVTTLAAMLQAPDDARRGGRCCVEMGMVFWRKLLSEAGDGGGILVCFIGSGPVGGFFQGWPGNVELTAAARCCREEASCYSCTGRFWNSTLVDIDVRIPCVWVLMFRSTFGSTGFALAIETLWEPELHPVRYSSPV